VKAHPLGPLPMGARPLRLLLAEDNAVNQRLAVRLLEKNGHTVVAVADGRAAVEAIESGSFDAVLLDVQMPVIDGLGAARAIRCQEAGTGKHMPLLALTAHALPADRTRCLEAGMDDYVSKPIRPPNCYRRLTGSPLRRRIICAFHARSFLRALAQP
jgi:two-component system sensor histidine kinase/response regulator